MQGSKITQEELISSIVAEALARPDAPITQARLSRHMVAVKAGRWGIASRGGCHSTHEPPLPELPETAHELAGWLADPPEVEEARPLGLAAVNALIPPPPSAMDLKAQVLIKELGQGRNVVVVGHFPFVEKMRDEFASLQVLELAPRPGDLPASSAARVIPEAELLAMTATSLMNGTMADLLNLAGPETMIIILGPSTPFASTLIKAGALALGGVNVLDEAELLKGLDKGVAFKQLRGAETLLWRP